MRYIATLNGQTEMVEIGGRDGHYSFVVGARTITVDARRTADGLYSLLVDGVSHVADVSPTGRGARVDLDGSPYLIAVEEYARHVIRTRGRAGVASGVQTITTPLPGKVTHVAVAPGDRVERGNTLVVIEAMKMENEFRAAGAGTVSDVRVRPGQFVNAGDVLVVVI